LTCRLFYAIHQDIEGKFFHHIHIHQKNDHPFLLSRFRAEDINNLFMDDTHLKEAP